MYCRKREIESATKDPDTAVKQEATALTILMPVLNRLSDIQHFEEITTCRSINLLFWHSAF